LPIEAKSTVPLAPKEIEWKGRGDKMEFICYPRCKTCQKARKWLDEHGIEYSFRDIQTDNPSAEELREFYVKSGLPLKRFWNTSGQKYRDLSLSKKLPNMSEEEQIALLATDGMLVKRPILVGEDFVLIGFKEDEWEETLSRYFLK